MNQSSVTSLRNSISHDIDVKMLSVEQQQKQRLEQQRQERMKQHQAAIEVYAQHKEDQHYEKMYAQQTRYQREIARNYPKKKEAEAVPAEEPQRNATAERTGEVRGYIRSLKAQQSGYSKHLSNIGRTP